MKDTIGLIHPLSCWHNNSDKLIGREIVVLDISECKRAGMKGWYYGKVKLVNPPKGFNCIADTFHMYGFRPRRIK